MPEFKKIFLNRILRNAATVILGLIIGATASLINSPGVQAAVASTYSPTLARNYSNTYTCNGSNCRNSAYVNLGGTDCTNFVSQALKAGNFPTNAGWFYGNSASYSASWVQVTAFKNFMVDQQQYAYIASPGMTSTYTSASIGDVYMYDWGHGAGYSHLSFAAGSGAFPSFIYDSSSPPKNYTFITGGSGSFVNQHSTDRWHSPWNLGYYIEQNLSIRANMKTKIISFN